MARHIRLGWIGAFADAREHYLPCIADWEDVQLTALCHPEDERLRSVAETFAISKTFSQPGVMLRTCELDAVFVTVPAGKSLPILEACIARRLHVCTNPATLPDLAALMRLARSVAETGVRFHVLFPRRHIGLLMDLRRQVEATGPLTHLAVTLHAPPGKLLPDDNLRVDRNEWLAGVDLLLYLGGDIVSFSGLVGRYHQGGNPSTLSALVQFAHGATGVLLSDRAAGHLHETIEMHGTGISAVYDFANHGYIWRPDAPNPTEKLHPQTDDGPAPLYITRGYDQAARKFIDAIIHDRPTETDLEYAIRTVDLLRRFEGLAVDDTDDPRDDSSED